MSHDLLQASTPRAGPGRGDGPGSCVVEVGEADAVFRSPLHPYTPGTCAAPRMQLGQRRENAALAGELPSPLAILGRVLVSPAVPTRV